MPAALAAALLAAGCATPPPPVPPLTVSQGVVIRDVNVVDTRTGKIASHMLVRLEGDRIVSVEPNRPILLVGSAQAVEAQGRYLVPGFLDMHSHALGSPATASDSLTLMLANGITGFREMAGSQDILARGRQLNADVIAGKVVAPIALQIPGDLILNARSPDLATAEVRRQKAMGADFIKLISGDRAGQLAVLAEARRQGLDVAGHLSPTLSATDAVDAGWHSIEHLGSGMGFLLDCASNEGAIRQAILNGEGAKPVPFSPAYINSPMLFRGGDVPLYQRILDSYSEQKCRALADRFVRAGVWNVPTLIRLHTIELSGDRVFSQDPNLEYMPRETVQMWQSLGQQFNAAYGPQAMQTMRNYYELQRRTVKLLDQRGAPMLAGSDSGGTGIWMIPGFALHQEFGELAAAGLSPLTVLQMTTINGARYLKSEATMGTVEAGKNADLVLLEGNPLDSVVNLDRIAGVAIRGRWLPRESLAAMKRQVAEARAIPTAARAGDPGTMPGSAGGAFTSPVRDPR